MAKPPAERSARLHEPVPTNPKIVRSLVALIDRDGTVTGIFNRPSAVRAYLQGGRA